MKIDINEHGEITLEEIKDIIEIMSSNGPSIRVYENNGTLEILANGILYEVTKYGDIREKEDN